MFRKPKIKAITSCSSGDFLFVFGLGSDGNMYLWDAVTLSWVLHKSNGLQPGPGAK